MKTKIILLTVISLFLISGVSGLTVVNSNDWKDVYSGMMYSHYEEDGQPYFVSTTSGTSIFEILPNNPVTLIESDRVPYSPNFGARLSTNSFEVEDRIGVRNGNLELQPKNVDNFIVVSEDYPSSAIISAPLARQTDSWVLIANQENVDEISSRLENTEEETLMIGNFPDSIREELEPFADEQITSSNRANLSIKVAERFKRENAGVLNNVRLSSGLFLEKSMFKQNMPVLLTGTNYLPEQTSRFIEENNVNNAYIIGNQLTSVGEEIKDEIDDVSVFVKYGQGKGDKMYALSMFSLPNSNPDLELSYSIYDPSSEKVYLGFENTGNSKLYKLTSFSITDNGNQIAASGDDSPIFIGSEQRKTLNYNIDPETELNGDEQIRLTTSYGPNTQAMTGYLTNEDKFEPPYIGDLSINRIQTDTNVTIENIFYENSESRFRVILRNQGDSRAFVDTDLTGIMIDGRNTSINGDRVSIEPGKQREIYLTAELSNQLSSSQETAIVSLNYGPEETSMVNGYRKKVEIKQSSGMFSTSPSPKAIAGAGILIAIIALFFYLNRKFDPKRMEQ